MPFWDLRTLNLGEFRPGILSRIESGRNLTMAVMEIAPDKEGTAHDHPSDQCGVVLEGEIEISIGEEKRLLHPRDIYFIPAGTNHSWRTLGSSATLFDVVSK